MHGRTDANIACVSSGGRRLIHVQTVDRPVSIGECSGVLSHVVIAGIGEGGAVGTILPDFSGPVSAKVCIEDNLHTLKMAWDIACSLIPRDWFFP